MFHVKHRHFCILLLLYLMVDHPSNHLADNHLADNHLADNHLADNHLADNHLAEMLPRLHYHTAARDVSRETSQR